MRVDGAVGEDNLQPETAFLLGLDQFLRIAVVRLDVVEVLVVTDEKVGFDRINQRDAGQRAGLGSDQVADLRNVDPGETVDRRSDAGEFQIEARLFDRGLGGGNRRFARFEGLISSSYCSRLITFLLSKSTARLALASSRMRRAMASSSWPVDWSRTALNGRGSIWKRSWPLLTSEPFS